MLLTSDSATWVAVGVAIDAASLALIAALVVLFVVLRGRRNSYAAVEQLLRESLARTERLHGELATALEEARTETLRARELGEIGATRGRPSGGTARPRRSHRLHVRRDPRRERPHPRRRLDSPARLEGEPIGTLAVFWRGEAREAADAELTALESSPPRRAGARKRAPLPRSAAAGRPGRPDVTPEPPLFPRDARAGMRAGPSSPSSSSTSTTSRPSTTGPGTSPETQCWRRSPSGSIRWCEART